MTDRTRVAPLPVDDVPEPPRGRRAAPVVAVVVVAGLAVALLPLLLLQTMRPAAEAPAASVAAPTVAAASPSTPTTESSTLPKLSYDPVALAAALTAAAGGEGTVTQPQLLFHTGQGGADGATAGLSACVADGSAAPRPAVLRFTREDGAWVVTERTWSATGTC